MNDLAPVSHMTDATQTIVDELLDDIATLCRFALGLKRQRDWLRRQLAEKQAELAAADVLLAAALDDAGTPPANPEVSA